MGEASQVAGLNNSHSNPTISAFLLALYILISLLGKWKHLKLFKINRKEPF